MPQLQAAIVGHNNTRAAVTGQEELLVRVNSADPGSGLATEATLQVIETNTTGVARTPGFIREVNAAGDLNSVVSTFCLLYTSPSPRDRQKSRMPSSA